MSNTFPDQNKNSIKIVFNKTDFIRENINKLKLVEIFINQVFRFDLERKMEFRIKLYKEKIIPVIKALQKFKRRYISNGKPEKIILSEKDIQYSFGIIVRKIVGSLAETGFLKKGLSSYLCVTLEILHILSSYKPGQIFRLKSNENEDEDETIITDYDIKAFKNGIYYFLKKLNPNGYGRTFSSKHKIINSYIEKLNEIHADPDKEQQRCDELAIFMAGILYSIFIKTKKFKTNIEIIQFLINAPSTMSFANTLNDTIRQKIT